MKKTSILPLTVKRALKKLGEDLREARIKRSLTMALIEERAGIPHATLTSVERGKSTVSIGIYAKVMFVLGLIDNLYGLADAENDPAGKLYAHELLPKRVRYKKKEN